MDDDNKSGNNEETSMGKLLSFSQERKTSENQVQNNDVVYTLGCSQEVTSTLEKVAQELEAPTLDDVVGEALELYVMIVQRYAIGSTLYFENTNGTITELDASNLLLGKYDKSSDR